MKKRKTIVIKEKRKIMKQQKEGISLIMLMVTIIVIILLVTTIAITYNGITNATKRKEFAKEIYTIGKLVEQYEFMHGKYPLSDDIIVELNMLDTSGKLQFQGEKSTDGNILLQKIDLREAGVETVKRGTMAKGDGFDVYAYSKATNTVYYIKGETIGENVYYTLTEELKKEIDLD